MTLAANKTLRITYTLHLGNVRATVTDLRQGLWNQGELSSQTSLASAFDYYPFGMIMPGRSFNADKYRFGYNGKEMDNEVKGTGVQYDYGARIYDARIAKFLSVDPLTKEFPWQSSYLAFDGNPINKIDPTGMSADWFQNELTGDVYYNSEMRKGDEGTGPMTGNGWVHMGQNQMFSDGFPTNSDASILMGNQGLGKVSMSLNYDKSPYADAKVTSVPMTGMFKGDNAQKLMGELGYDFNPVLFEFHSDVTTEYHPEQEVTITHDNSRVEEVLSSRYISQDLVLKNTLTLGNYKTPLPPVIKSYGPVYSIRDQSWTVRQNVYGTSAFGRNFGKTINWLEKNTPWKSAYEELLKKAIK